MRDRVLTLPEVFFVAATRGMLGAGIALLLSDQLTKEERRAAGLVLAGIGAVTTIPSAMALLRRSPIATPAAPAIPALQHATAAGQSSSVPVPQY